MPAREQIFEMDTPLVAYSNKSLHKGMNTRLHRRLLDDNEAQLLVNADITLPGLRTRKKAPSNVGSNLPIRSALGPRGLAAYTPAQGTTRLVISGCVNPVNNIITWDGVTQSTIAFTGAGTISDVGLHRWYQAVNCMYGTDRVNAPWKLSGTTLTTPGIVDASGTPLVNVGDMLWFFNRMWYAIGDEIHFSEVGNPESITYAPLKVNTGSGDTIVRLMNYRDKWLVIFKASTGSSGSIHLIDVSANEPALFQQNITPFYDALTLCSPETVMRLSSNSDADLLFNTREGYRSMAFTDLNSLLGPSLPLTDHIPDYSYFPFEGISDFAHAVMFSDEILLFIPIGQATPTSIPTTYKTLGCSRRIPGNSPQEGWCIYDMMPATRAVVAALTNDTQPYLYLTPYDPGNFNATKIQRAFQSSSGIHVYQEKGKGIDYGDPSNNKLPRVIHGSFAPTGGSDQVVTSLVDDLGVSRTVPLLSTGIFTAAGTYEIERTLDFDSNGNPMPANADVSVAFTASDEVAILGYKLQSMVEENQPIPETQAFATPVAATAYSQTQLAATNYTG